MVGGTKEARREGDKISACLLIAFLYKSDFCSSPKKEMVISTSQHVSGGQVSVWEPDLGRSPSA